jgi:hypothetical protein
MRIATEKPKTGLFSSFVSGFLHKVVNDRDDSSGQIYPKSYIFICFVVLAFEHIPHTRRALLCVVAQLMIGAVKRGCEAETTMLRPISSQLFWRTDRRLVHLETETSDELRS